MKQIEHVPQVVDAGRLSDELVMGTLVEFTRNLHAYRESMPSTSAERHRFHNLLDGGIVLAGEAWRRGLLDATLLRTGDDSAGMTAHPGYGGAFPED